MSANQLEQHVRALLRDVLCGYLSADLKAAADDILLASSAEIEIKAADLRTADRRPQTAEAEPVPVAAEPEPPPPPPPPPPVQQQLEPEDDDLDAGVTPSADWDTFSAPI